MGDVDIEKSAKKRLAMFLDGTWNTTFDNTNVWRLKSLCSTGSSDGCRQLSYYSDGLGTRVGERFLGGMMGYGLDQAVIDAYKWLVDCYDSGDEIFIFGFSRGAYTARSLAGFIAKCGLLRAGAPLSIRQLYDRYRLTPDARTIGKLAEDRQAGVPERMSLEERWMLDYSIPVRLKMIGVYDTVGALGIPFGKVAGVSRSGFNFLHTGLRVSQENAYHALAIDEHRLAFAPTLWTKRFPKGVPVDQLAKPRSLPSTEQRWFIGAHANVGGGCRSDLLAQLPLRWMMTRASALGLAFRHEVDLDPDGCLAPIADSFTEFLGGVYRWARFGRRFHRDIGAPPVETETGQVETINETIDPSVFDRWRRDPSYRPPGLARWAERHTVDPASLNDAVRADDPRARAPD